jgi:hypothetical protein
VTEERRKGPKLQLDASAPAVCAACGAGFSVIAPHVTVRLARKAFCPFCGAVVALQWARVPRVWTMTKNVQAMQAGQATYYDTGSGRGFDEEAGAWDYGEDDER